MANGIDLILADHRMVDELFSAFAATSDGTIVGKVIDALTVHDDAEHGALYPFAEATLGADAIGDVLERSALAHSAVKKQIDECKFLEGAPLVDAFAVLQALVEDHVKDEEKNLLPALEKVATPDQLDVLASRILQAKQRIG